MNSGKLSAITLAALLAVAGSTATAMGPGGGMGGGMGGGHMMSNGMMYGNRPYYGPPPAPRQPPVQRPRAGQRQEQETEQLRLEISERRRELSDLIRSGSPNKDLIDQRIQELGRLEAELDRRTGGD